MQCFLDCLQYKAVAAPLDAGHLELGLDRHGGSRLGLRRDAGPDQLREERREVPADDLRRRPPEWLGARRTRTTGQLAVEVMRPITRQQEAAQHRPEWPRLDLDAGRGRDRLGGGFGLLGRKSALLDGERRDVPGRIDVRRADDASVRIDGNEALERLRDAADPLALQSRQRDDAIGRENIAADQQELSLACLRRVRMGVHHDSALLEERANRRAGLVAEQMQRLDLGRHEGELHVVHSSRCEPARRQKGELVDGEAPDGPGRDRERDAPNLTRLDLRQETLDPVRICGPTERQGTVDGRPRHGSAGDQKHRIRNGASGRGVGDVTRRIDRDELSVGQGRACCRDQIGQIEVPHLAECERFRHGERPVPELRLRCEHLDANRPLPQRTKRQCGLERSDPTARDEHIR